MERQCLFRATHFESFSQLQQEVLNSFGAIAIPGVVIVACAWILRHYVDSLKMNGYLLLENRKRNLITERVRRYNLEHNMQIGTCETSPHKSHSERRSSGSEVQSQNVSAMTAPSVILQPVIRGTCGGSQGLVDCVPADHLVHIEGHELPVEARSVQLKQRVLCLDAASSTMKYVQVLSKEVNAAPEDGWLVITLSDGSKCTVTEDHPLAVVSSGNTFKAPQSCIRARDITPHEHYLPSLQLKQLPVQDVQRVTASEAAIPERATLKVHQPDRHSILIKSPQCTSCNFQAVGSADASPFESLSRRSFITFDDAEAFDSELLPHAPLKRSNSAPASVCGIPGKLTHAERKIGHVKSWSVYKEWQETWRKRGRNATDPVTPRADLSRSNFNTEFREWTTALKQTSKLAL
eukprot:TRINITY_DN14474_c0_g2_i7.p1 TRINITY_DN14474_c0_g2~~TRINITY_DN14474_c0_g2_i7.p1  ORF type:complete len:461 (-),score=62.31 TRINITY_DN14474_c0_g2_i7:39-1259(-)